MWLRRIGAGHKSSASWHGESPRLLVSIAMSAMSLLAVACSPSLPPPPPWTPGDYVAPPPDPPLSEGSLWHGGSNFGQLFVDVRARQVGDLLTVAIVESAQAEKMASTETSRESNLSAGISNFFGTDLTWGGFEPRVSGGFSNDFEGEGTTKRKDTLVATVSAKVVEVLPGGLMRIEGYRDVTINMERQYILLRGVVRPEDIGPDNTVLSSDIADAQIAYAGNGVVSDKQRPGWFTRALDYAWPF